MYKAKVTVFSEIHTIHTNCNVITRRNFEWYLVVRKVTSRL